MPRIDDIPPVTTDIRAPAMHPYLVFIFAFNEGTKLASQLSKFPPAGERAFDIMIGDDGSDDGSVNASLIEKYGVRGIVRLDRNRGLSANIKGGLHWFLSRAEYEGVIMMNGNDKDDPEAIPRFIRKLREGYDYVQGSRFLPDGTAENTPALRHFGIRFVHGPLFSLAAGKWMTDTTNGFRAFSRSYLSSRKIHIFQEAFQKYEVEQYLGCRAIQLKFACCEIPVARRYPPRAKKATRGGFTKIKPGIGHWQMIKPLIMLNLGLYR